jgi:hypothetical protein
LAPIATKSVRATNAVKGQQATSDSPFEMKEAAK